MESLSVQKALRLGCMCRRTDGAWFVRGVDKASYREFVSRILNAKITLHHLSDYQLQ
jgi:hypothetical protein